MLPLSLSPSPLANPHTPTPTTMDVVELMKFKPEISSKRTAPGDDDDDAGREDDVGGGDDAYDARAVKRRRRQQAKAEARQRERDRMEQLEQAS